MKKYPLVSICVPNYNYGEYLEYCLDSILNQTYPNIEVLFRDNQSTDNSYEIALSYRDKFRDKGFYYNVSQNKKNIGSDGNSNYLSRDIEGEYIFFLASDDAIEPTFIEKCIRVFDENPSVAMVMVHRSEIDEFGNIHQLPPFYNQNCVVDGESQAAVFMMAGIAIPGQRMQRASMLNPIKKYKRIFNVAGDWYNNFLAAMCGDVAYIKEPLCQYRVHTGNETNESEKNLLGIFEHYQLIHAFCDISKQFGMSKPAERYHEAVEKLGSMCLRYALKMYKCGEKEAAVRYLFLAPALKRNIVEDERYAILMNMERYIGLDLKREIEEFEKKFNLNRTISYNPPENYRLLDI